MRVQRTVGRLQREIGGDREAPLSGFEFRKQGEAAEPAQKNRYRRQVPPRRWVRHYWSVRDEDER